MFTQAMRYSFSKAPDEAVAIYEKVKPMWSGGWSSGGPLVFDHRRVLLAT